MKKFDNYCSNLDVLCTAQEQDLTNPFILSGIVDVFSLQFELGWKTLKELLQYEGRREASTGSPREIIKTAYAVYEFIDEEVWLSMLKSRNVLSHIYDKSQAKEVVEMILEQYIPAFCALKDSLTDYYPNLLEKL